MRKFPAANIRHHGEIRFLYLAVILLCFELGSATEEGEPSTFDKFTEFVNVDTLDDTESWASGKEESAITEPVNSDNQQQMIDQNEQEITESRTVEGPASEGCAALFVEAPEDGNRSNPRPNM